MQGVLPDVGLAPCLKIRRIAWGYRQTLTDDNPIASRRIVARNPRHAFASLGTRDH
jgi:hypothetical protein